MVPSEDILGSGGAQPPPELARIGEFSGMPPTNRKVTLGKLEIDRVVGGKIVEIRARADTLGMMQQLGE